MSGTIFMVSLAVGTCASASQCMVNASDSLKRGKYINAAFLFLSAWASVLAMAMLACVYFYRLGVHHDH